MYKTIFQRLNVTIPKFHNSFDIIRSFHPSSYRRGFEEFYDEKKPNEIVLAGRAWTVPDLRRKSFDDLHKLWYVLYKERNLLLTSRDKFRKNSAPMPDSEESRYLSVKRSMGAIKFVLHERKKIAQILSPDQYLKDMETPRELSYMKLRKTRKIVRRIKKKFVN